VTLRSLPLSERLFATAATLALGAFLAGGLAFVLNPTRPATAGRSRLIAVVEGVMAPHTSPAEADAFRAWVAGGATRDAYGPVDAIVTRNCAACHGDGGQPPRLARFEDLRPLALETTGIGLYTAIGARGLHLALFPLVFLAAGLGYLRRVAWRGRRTLLAVGAAAVLFDAAQAAFLPGRPALAWSAAGLLAASYAAVGAAVLRDLWRKPAD
jgi:hypothetical protein